MDENFDFEGFYKKFYNDFNFLKMRKPTKEFSTNHFKKELTKAYFGCLIFPFANIVNKLAKKSVEKQIKKQNGDV